MLSAAVFANIYEARNQYAQDWYDWLQQGLIDRAYPMAYQMNIDIFTSQLQNMSQHCDPASIVVGIRAWDSQGKSLMNIEDKRYGVNDVAKRIQVIREHGFAGIALFSYEGLKLGNALQYLGDLSYFVAPELDCRPLLSRAAIGYPGLELFRPKERHQAPAPQKATAEAKSVKASFFADKDLYIIHLNIPEEGRWSWELQDEQQKRIYHRYRYYSKGDNEDYWDGLLEGDDRVLAGRYNLILDSGEAVYQADVYLNKLLP